MTAPTTFLTAEQLAVLPDNGYRYELVQGELQMMAPAGGRHGRIAFRLGLLLGSHVVAHELGEVYAAETGFLVERDPDTVRAPDVSFVAKQRAALVRDDSGFVPIVPDLVAEVVSPNDSFSAVEEKALAWIRYGVRLVLVVDPVLLRIHAYRDQHQIQVLDEQSRLDAADVVPGWVLNVAELFR